MNVKQKMMNQKISKPEYLTSHCIGVGKKQSFIVEYIIREYRIVVKTRMETNDKWDESRVEYYLN